MLTEGAGIDSYGLSMWTESLRFLLIGRCLLETDFCLRLKEYLFGDRNFSGRRRIDISEQWHLRTLMLLSKLSSFSSVEERKSEICFNSNLF